MKLAEKIEYLVKHSEFTVTDIAAGIGVTRTVIYNWMSGKAYPKSESIRNVAKFFSVPAEWLLADEENELPPKAKAQELDSAIVISEAVPEPSDVGLSWSKPQPNRLHFFSTESFVGVSPAQCVVFKATDDSLAPLIRVGDYVLIRKYRDTDKIKNGSVYLISFADNKIFRRFFMKLNGDFIISTDDIASGETVCRAEVGKSIVILGEAVERSGKL